MTLGALLAVIAAIIFAVATFGGRIGNLNLIAFGLIFLALAIATGGVVLFRRD